jgi:hypothetical protein
MKGNDMVNGRRPADRGDEDGDDPFERDTAGIIPMEEEATGYLPVPEGDDSYDVLRMPHERDESVDPPPRTSRRPRATPRRGR